MKTIMKLTCAAFAVVLAVGALTANSAPAAPTARPTPTPRPRPAGPPSLAASINGNGQNFGGFVYEYPRYGVQNIFASGLSRPRGVAFASAGNLFVATSFVNGSTSQGSVVKITPDGVQSTFVTMDCCDTFPEGLAFDGAGNLFVNVLHTSSFDIYKFTPDGVQSTFASPPGVQGFGLAFDSAGNLYTAVNFETEASQIWKYLPDGTPSLFATATDSVSAWTDLTFDRFGNLFVSDDFTPPTPSKILKFTPDGVESDFATGLSGPRGLAFDSGGNLFAADLPAGEVLKFTPSGRETVFASGISTPQFLAFSK